MSWNIECCPLRRKEAAGQPSFKIDGMVQSNRDSGSSANVCTDLIGPSNYCLAQQVASAVVSRVGDAVEVIGKEST
jgi:hypothetical protein